MRMRGADVSIPLDALDPEQAYREWREGYLWHVDHLPEAFVEDVGQLVLPHLRAAKLQERVTGGGYVDNIPVSDSRASRDMAMLWAVLRAYLTCASSRIGVEAPIIPFSLPEVADARRWAYDASGWLTRMVDQVRSWPDLDELQATLFPLIRRYASNTTPVELEPVTQLEWCDTCGEQAVLIDWIPGPQGEPMLAKACTVCGTKPGAGS
jgi:hypothetical protein